MRLLVQGEFTVLIQGENFRACIILALSEITTNSGDKQENGDINLEEINI